MSETLGLLVPGFVLFVFIAISSYVGALRALAVFHGEGDSIFLGDHEGPAASNDAE
ncbi:MAG: hypothetical protein ACOCUA_01275 [archaeon]